MNRPPQIAIRVRSTKMRSPANRDRKATTPSSSPSGRRNGLRLASARSSEKTRHARCRQRHVAGADLAVHQPPAQHRAGPDADRERGEEQRYDAGAGAQRLLREGRDLRQEHRADQPEPRRAEDRQLDVAALPGLTQDRGGRGDRVAAEAQCGRGRRGARHEQARGEPRSRAQASSRQAASVPRSSAMAMPSGDRPKQDRQERAAFEQRVAVDQLVRVQCCGSSA